LWGLGEEKGRGFYRGDEGEFGNKWQLMIKTGDWENRGLLKG